MNEFDGRRKEDMRLRAAPQGGAAEQNQQRAQPFPARIHDVVAHVFHHIHVRVQLLHDELVHSFEFICDDGAYLVANLPEHFKRSEPNAGVVPREVV